jgi:hypothetical protein
MRGALFAGLVLGALVLAACGGGGDDVDLPPGDAGAIQQLFIDFVKAKDSADEEGLAATFSVQCTGRDENARQIISNWDRFREDIDIKVLSVDFAQLEAAFAVATPKAQLDVEGLDPQDASTFEAELVKEDGAWKLATCSYNIPGSTQPVEFQ